VARIQAVDVVRPFLARALGLAELRVRLAGSVLASGASLLIALLVAELVLILVSPGVLAAIRKVTTWVPLEKVQSVRMVTGPVQRVLSLATVHVDAAGRRVRAEFRDRPGGEAGQLVEELAALCRGARRRAAQPGVPPAPVIPAQGRLPDADAVPSPASQPGQHR
jgi:membrane protein YdbS with pleckstrin-like domain